MKKALPKIIAGLVITGAGVAVGYLYLAGTSQGKNFILLCISLALIAGGLFIFSRIGDAVYNLNTDTELEKPQAPKEGLQSVLEKNNEMVQDYANTAKTRDNLKVLEIAGAAEEQAK